MLGSERACIVLCQPLGGTTHLGLLRLFLYLRCSWFMLVVLTQTSESAGGGDRGTIQCSGNFPSSHVKEELWGSLAIPFARRVFLFMSHQGCGHLVSLLLVKVSCLLWDSFSWASFILWYIKQWHTLWSVNNGNFILFNVWQYKFSVYHSLDSYVKLILKWFKFPWLSLPSQNKQNPKNSCPGILKLPHMKTSVGTFYLTQDLFTLVALFPHILAYKI